jgi:UDP-N-acetylmuramoyl-tripeptide--D-alanyl-D-alanine ligase
VEWSAEDEEASSFRTELIGSYNLPNILAALCIGHHFGVGGARMETAIAGYRPDNNRSQVVETDKNTLVLDAYNANPSSMEAAIESFVDMEGGPKAFILGDMLEMGSFEEEVHTRILKLLQEKELEEGILVGEAFFRAAQGASIQAYPSLEDAEKALRQDPYEGYRILIKGSRGLKLEKLIELL